MKKITLLLLSLILLQSASSGKNYYVNVNGSDNNSGLSPSLAWESLTYAASARSPAVGGDTVFVKAGNYGSENVIFETDGQTNKPIVYMGYQNTPGDSPNLNYKLGDALNPNVMPLFNGGNRATGIGFYIYNIGNIVIKNFQITNYKIGLAAPSSGFVKVENVITMTTGDINTYYVGYGIWFGIGANYMTIENCIAVNSCAEGISVYGNYNTIKNSKVYCNENITNEAPTDYYIFVTGNYNKILNCYVERVGDLYHQGHGIGLKGNCANNTFENCTAVNCTENFYVRHRGVKNNSFKKCKALKYGGIAIRDGASKNTFEDFIIDSCFSAIRFSDTSEDGGAQYCGRNNLIKNSIIKNSYYAIDFNEYDTPSVCDSNTIANCIFYNATNLFNARRLNQNNTMVNCIAQNVKNLKAGAFTVDCKNNYSNFYGNGFATPAGQGNISANPNYVNESAGNFHLKSGSLCIDKGTSLNNVLTDFDNSPRPKGTSSDIGPFEFDPQTVAVTELELNETVLAFPNPSDGSLTIKNSNTTTVQFIEIINSLGQSIYTVHLNPSEETKVNLAPYGAGCYFLRFNHSASVKKLIIF